MQMTLKMFRNPLVGNFSFVIGAVLRFSWPGLWLVISFRTLFGFWTNQDAVRLSLKQYFLCASVYWMILVMASLCGFLPTSGSLFAGLS